jgi:putative ABC transport system permease protein
MRGFRNPFLNALFEHPVATGFTVALLAALVPVVVYLLSPRKVPLRYNLRNLQNRWKTTLVTAIAFTLVVGGLTAMLAFVKGMDRLLETSGNPGNVMVLSDGATDEAFSNLPDFSVEQLPKDLQDEVVMFTKEVFVVVMYMVPNPAAGARPRRFVQMRGLDNMEVAAEIHGVQLGSGTWPNESGVRKIGSGEADTAREIVVGHGVARTFGADIGKSILEPGDIVTLGPRQWVVAGIMAEGSASFSSEIWTRDLNMQEDFGRKNSYCSYVVRTKGPEKANLAVQLLKDFKSERNLQAFTEQEYYAKMSDTSKAFTAAIYVVAVIMAVGGALGIMNTMFAAISQRGKDIGVLRLMGFRRGQILMSFLFESLVIAVLGGILGCALAYLLFDGLIVTSIISSGAGGGGRTVVFRMSVDFQVLLIGIIFMLSMGLLGGAIPAITAMRLRPLESLK